MPSDPGFQRPHFIAGPADPLGHEALLTLARKVRAAASDSDPERLRDAVRRFSVALDRHLQTEVAALNRIVPAESRLLKRGQRRISSLADSLLDEAVTGCPASKASCRSRSEELLALLSLQARDEHQALHSPAA